jgi:hypothetical protein
MAGLIDLTGQRFGRWVVIGKGQAAKFAAMWQCRCDCSPDIIHNVRSDHLRNGKSSSCGCLRSEELSSRLRTHGRSKTRTYKIWETMIQRCTNPTATGYDSYGGRGIGVDESWKLFENFFADMGEPPSEAYTLDRRDVNLGYSQSNCRWATIDIQANNKRSCVYIEYNGLRLTRTQWARRLGLAETSLRARLQKGWSLERALTPKKAR